MEIKCEPESAVPANQVEYCSNAVSVKQEPERHCKEDEELQDFQVDGGNYCDSFDPFAKLKCELVEFQDTRNHDDALASNGNSLEDEFIIPDLNIPTEIQWSLSGEDDDGASKTDYDEDNSSDSDVSCDPFADSSPNQHFLPSSGKKKSTNPVKNGPFKCLEDKCSRTFNFAANLKLHLLRKHGKGQSVGTFSCDKCNKSFKFKGDLKYHASVHTENKPFKCATEGCGATFKRRYSLTRHQQENCSSTKDSLRKIKTARELWDPKERPFQCTIDNCSSKFKKAHHLNSHITYTHMKTTPEHKKVELVDKYECKVCHKLFDRKQSVVAHSVVHSHEKPFKCSNKGCKSAFKRNFHCKLHEKKCRN